jgi:hypothetical protein
MKINGLMIDCARLLERKEYYHRLLEFMAHWKMNTLVLHFSDDHGFALRLRGFNDIALPHAFTPAELAELLARASSLGIDVIPEVEAFGHTRYLTDARKYRHLYAGTRTRAIRFNAIDPLSKDTHAVMRRLIRAVAKAFPSRYLHLGCDEVDLSGYCDARGLEVAEVWTDYVNRMIEIARKAGKEPMIWADHVVHSDAVAERLRKDVILVEWHYSDAKREHVIPRLKKSGFKEFVVAPSIACYRYRYLPPREAFENTNAMLAIGKQQRALGLINTVWCPYRYLQNAMYYGIAYSAYAVKNGIPADLAPFKRKFARDVFGTSLTVALDAFLDAWSELFFDHTVASRLCEPDPEFSARDVRVMRKVARAGRQALEAAENYTPKTNADIWHGMVLAAQGMWLCAESVMLRNQSRPGAKRIAAYNKMLTRVRREMSVEWDRTRYADDPQKRKPKFPNEGSNFAMVLLRRLPRM